MKRLSVSFWLLLAITAAPVIGGWVFYLNPHWLPDTRANRGELIDPVVALQELTLRDRTGAVIALGRPEGRWRLLLSVDQCSDACRRALWTTRQVRLALGEGRTRVERLLVLGSEPPPQLEAWLQTEHPGLRVAAPEGERRKRMQQLLAAVGEAFAGDIFVVDPMGNLMMRYTAGTPGDDMLSDFERLLKISENWSAYASH